MFIIKVVKLFALNVSTLIRVWSSLSFKKNYNNIQKIKKNEKGWHFFRWHFFRWHFFHLSVAFFPVAFFPVAFFPVAFFPHTTLLATRVGKGETNIFLKVALFISRLKYKNIQKIKQNEKRVAFFPVAFFPVAFFPFISGIFSGGIFSSGIFSGGIFSGGIFSAHRILVQAI